MGPRRRGKGQSRWTRSKRKLFTSPLTESEEASSIPFLDTLEGGKLVIYRFLVNRICIDVQVGENRVVDNPEHKTLNTLVEEIEASTLQEEERKREAISLDLENFHPQIVSDKLEPKMVGRESFDYFETEGRLENSAGKFLSPRIEKPSLHTGEEEKVDNAYSDIESESGLHPHSPSKSISPSPAIIRQSDSPVPTESPLTTEE